MRCPGLHDRVVAASGWVRRAADGGFSALSARTVRRRAALPLAAGLTGAALAFALLAFGGRTDGPLPARRAARLAAHGAAQAAGLPRRDTGRLVSLADGRSGGAAFGRAVALERALDLALRRTAAAYRAPAASAAVVACGRVVWAGATGVLSLRSRHPASNSTLFIINSAAKTIVATMVMDEVQAGRLSLQTPLSSFFPWLPDASVITVRMLLNMTSGLPEYLRNPRIHWVINHQPLHRWTVDQLLTGLGTGLGGPDFYPGTAYQYSDTNYIVLGAILERVTHAPIQQDFQRLIAGPLGITSATFVRTPAALALLAHPYLLYPDGRLVGRWFAGFGPPSADWGPTFTDGGLAASALDLARFANALLAGRLVRPAYVRKMIHLGRHHYGLGIQGRVFAGHLWLGHYGAYGGYEAEDWSLPSGRLTIATATNIQRLAGGLVSERIWRALVRAYDRLAPVDERCGYPSEAMRATSIAMKRSASIPTAAWQLGVQPARP